MYVYVFLSTFFSLSHICIAQNKIVILVANGD